MKPHSVTIQMKAIEQYFHVVLFVMLFKVVLTFESVNETLVRDQSSGSYWAALKCVLFIMLYKVFQLKSLDETLVCDHPNESYWAALSCSLVWNCLLYRVIFTFVYEIPVCQEPINQNSVFLKTELYSWYMRLSRYNYKISPAGTCMVAVLLIFFFFYVA